VDSTSTTGNAPKFLRIRVQWHTVRKRARIRKEFTIRTRFQEGHVFLRRGKRRRVWAARWREDVITPDGTVKRILRFAILGTSSEIKGKKEARDILQAKLRPINQGRQRPQSTMTLEQFVSELWKPGVIPTLRSGSSRYYDVQLRCHILPAFGLRRLCDITRVDVQCFSRARCSSDRHANRRNSCTAMEGP
jgi:hypothetical protein